MYLVYFLRVLDVGLECVFLHFQVVHEFEDVHFVNVAEALLDKHEVEVVVNGFLECFVGFLECLHGGDVILVALLVVELGVYLLRESG